MLNIIDANSYENNYHLLEQMYEIRALIFNDRLGWDVKVFNGIEKDLFDDQDPVYILSIENDTVLGSLRLLPTTGPNMLRDVFPALIPDGIIASPLIWESSRFCINPKVTPKDKDKAVGFVNKVTIELLCGIVEVGQMSGLDYVVSVYDARMARLFRTIDCPSEIIGVPQKIGRVMTYAGLFPINDKMWRRLARSGGDKRKDCSMKIVNEIKTIIRSLETWYIEARYHGYVELALIIEKAIKFARTHELA